MKVATTLCALLLAALLPIANTAVAGDADFVLSNRTGYDIESVFVVPTKQKNWGKDHLGDGILANGKSRKISFDKQSTNCVYDIAIHWVGYDSSHDRSWERIDLCAIHKISLYYNEKTDVTTMKAE
ncbi:hypothetical protein [Caenimonas koreensis]|uniref:hypothetical protein n=1 Tax=Caenimonas koreensis TaxID=367474 RepID=UPI003783B8E5